MHDRVVPLPGASMAVDDPLVSEFEACLAETSTLAFRVAYSVLRHREEAEEVAQDAFLRAYRRFRQLRDRARFRGWLVRITFRLALDRQRSTRRRLSREHGVASSTSASDAVVADRVDRLWSAIDQLPERLRWAIVLAAIHGYHTREVAALLQVPEGTVKSRLFEARRRLKELMS